MYTPPATPLPPDLLYRKPGTVTAAQVMLWLQFSFLICCGTGTGLAGLFWSSLVDFEDFGFADDFSEGVEDLASLVVVVIVVVVALVILLGILAAKIGAGRRWAQVMTILVMLAAFVIGFLGLYAGFETQEGAPVDGSRLLGTLAGLSMPLVTLICLFTGSANQWFRQKGREPLKALPPQLPPYAPYR
ncbi:hypothetical protein AB0B28_21145 [Glycomyces sp. NPDC046736]|uniref:hypothetical protein n=1 Tax=Glycomyces sp. NPDC046736 TaxID=3155615 RepID=UPI0033E305BD